MTEGSVQGPEGKGAKEAVVPTKSEGSPLSWGWGLGLCKEKRTALHSGLGQPSGWWGTHLHWQMAGLGPLQGYPSGCSFPGTCTPSRHALFLAS